MQDDWEFCSRDLAATSQLLRPVGSGSGFVFADRSISYPQPNALRPLRSHHAISMKGEIAQGGAPSLILLRKAFIVRHFYFGLSAA